MSGRIFRKSRVKTLLKRILKKPTPEIYMLQLNDYQCTNLPCPNAAKIVELLLEPQARPRCEGCQQEMTKEFPAPKGYVKYSHNPVKQNYTKNE
jgi:hypothetical protein